MKYSVSQENPDSHSTMRVRILLGHSVLKCMHFHLGDTALHYAAYGKKVEAIKLLLEMGADSNRVNGKNCSTLHISVLMKDLESVRLLLEQPNIDVNVTDAFDDSPLHEAIVKGKFFRTLLKKTQGTTDYFQK